MHSRGRDEPGASSHVAVPEGHHDEHPEASGAAVAGEPPPQGDAPVDNPSQGDAVAAELAPDSIPEEDGPAPELPGTAREFEFVDVSAVANPTAAPGDSISRVSRSTPRDSSRESGRARRPQPPGLAGLDAPPEAPVPARDGTRGGRGSPRDHSRPGHHPPSLRLGERPRRNRLP